VSSLRDRVAELEAENAALRALVERLEARIVELERELGRHSGNSSLPPSSDSQAQRETRAERRRAARAEAKRKPGKQPGAPGAHLERVEVPDRSVTHTPVACAGCGASLADGTVTGVESRQVFDLPARRAEVTDHVVERRRCACGRETTAVFPPQARAAACWGPHVRALAVYLLVRHHVPVERAGEILSDLCGAPVSTGWLGSLSGEAASGLEPFIDDVKDRLVREPVVHADETGARVAGAKWWFHVVSTALFTFLAAHPRRGNAATDEHGILGRYTGTLVSDRWRPYWSYEQLAHQICGAHLLRDLEGVGEVATQTGWTDNMRALLLDALRRTEAARAAGHTELSRYQRSRLRTRYRKIVADAFAANPEPIDQNGQPHTRDTLERAAYNLAVAFEGHEHEILRYTQHLNVPFTNNQAERDLRMVKLQQKISGTFRTTRGAERFATIRSYIETGRKHGHNPIDLLTDLFTGHPWAIPT
jgi:transposase